jgi:aspartate aminotransferase
MNGVCPMADLQFAQSLDAPRNRIRLHRAGACGRALGRRRPRHHQPRDRAAGFPHPGPHRRGGRQGAARRASRLYPRQRPARPARGRRRQTCNHRHGAEVDPDNVVVIVPGGKPTMFFAVLMFGEPRSRDHVPQPGLSDLRIRHPLFRCHARADPRCSEENGFAFSAEAVLAPDHACARGSSSSTRPANPTGGVTPQAQRSTGWSRASPTTRRWRSCRTRSTARCSMAGATHVSLLQYPEIRDRLILLDGWSKTYAMTGWRHGLRRLARGCGRARRRGCASTTIPASTPRRNTPGSPRSPARNSPCCDMVAAFDRRRRQVIVDASERPAGCSAAPTRRGAFYAFPNIQGTGMSATEAQNIGSWKRRAWPPSRARHSAPMGEGYRAVLLRQFSTENILEACRRIRELL